MSNKKQNKKPQVIIVGAGGTGKTAFTERMIKDAEEKGKKVTVFTINNEGPPVPLIMYDGNHQYSEPPPIPHMKLVEGPFSCFPTELPFLNTINRLKRYNTDWSTSTGKNHKRKKRKKKHRSKKRK